MPGGAESVVSGTTYDMSIPMQRSTSYSTYYTNLTEATYDDEDSNFPSVTFANNEDDLVSTATFETRDDRPFTGCMSALVYDVTDGWYQFEDNVKSCSDIHSCKAPSIDMPSCKAPSFSAPSCNADAYNCGNSIKTQTATLWIGSSRISCTVPVCSSDTTYDARTSRGAASHGNLMDMYEYDDDDMSAYSNGNSYGRGASSHRRNFSSSQYMYSGYRLGKRSLSLARSSKGVSRIRSGIAQVGSFGKKVSKPSMKMIKLGRKDKERALSDIEEEAGDEAEDPSFVHAAATEVKESINKAGTKIESKLKEEQNAILSSINHETAKVSNSIKLAADATSLVTSCATSTVSIYQQKIMDEHTKALKSHTNAISQRLLAVEQKMIQANEYINASHQQILNEANGVVPVSKSKEDGGSLEANNNDELEETETSPQDHQHQHHVNDDDDDDDGILFRCTVMDGGPEGIEVVDNVMGEGAKGIVVCDDDNSMWPSHSTGSSASSGSSCSIVSYKYDNRMFGGSIGTGEGLDEDSFNMEVKMPSNDTPTNQRNRNPSIDTQTEDTLNAVLDGYHAHDEASQQELFLSSGEE